MFHAALQHDRYEGGRRQLLKPSISQGEKSAPALKKP
jgi:hypothetical protein